MRDGFPTTSDASDPTKFYVRLMYHEWWYGPFDDVDGAVTCLATCDARHPYWGYDCPMIERGGTGSRYDLTLDRSEYAPLVKAKQDAMGVAPFAERLDAFKAMGG